MILVIICCALRRSGQSPLCKAVELIVLRNWWMVGGSEVSMDVPLEALSDRTTCCKVGGR